MSDADIVVRMYEPFAFVAMHKQVCLTSHHITSPHITSHHITSHHITTQHNTSHPNL
jgi:hypothetical protein